MTALGQWSARYAPGDWLVLCGPTSVVVIEPPGAGWTALAAELWREVVAAATLPDLAARLGAYGLDTMPSFGALFWTSAGMRSLVRGSVRIVDPDGDRVVASGEGVQTWSEAGLGHLVEARIETAAPPADDALELPLVVGAVLASFVTLDARPGARVESPQLDEDGLESTEPVDFDDVEQPMATARTERDVTPAGPAAGPTSGAPEPTVDLGHRPGPDVADTELFEPQPPAPVPSGPTVLAVVCPHGHPSPPGTTRCHNCGVRVVDARPRPVAQPTLATLRVGDSIEALLDRVVLVGRAPQYRGDAEVRLLTVPSLHHDISRTHLEFAVDNWQVTVKDLNSTNGTVLVDRDGARRRPLPAGVAVVVELGSVLELAEGVAVLVDMPQ